MSSSTSQDTQRLARRLDLVLGEQEADTEFGSHAWCNLTDYNMSEVHIRELPNGNIEALLTVGTEVAPATTDEDECCRLMARELRELAASLDGMPADAAEEVERLREDLAKWKRLALERDEFYSSERGNVDMLFAAAARAISDLHSLGCNKDVEPTWVNAVWRRLEQTVELVKELRGEQFKGREQPWLEPLEDE